MRSRKNDLKERGIVRTGYGPGKPNIWHAHEVDEATRRKSYGHGVVEIPGKMAAGEFATVVVEFHIGEEKIPSGGHLGLFWRWGYDWSDLQTDEPSEQGFLTVSITSTSGRSSTAKLSVRYNAHGGIEPYNHALKLTVTSGELIQGDCIRLICGDRTAGSPGWRAPTLVAEDVGFLLLQDSEGNEQWTEFIGPQSQTCQIVPQKPEKLIVIARSDLVVGEDSQLIIKAEDCWGNAVALDEIPKLSIEGNPDAIVFENIRQAAEGRVYHATLKGQLPGLYRVLAQSNSLGLTSTSNPFWIHTKPPEHSVFWGDLHAGQCDMGCGAGSLADHYGFGRDIAGLQFITHQPNDHYVTSEDWIYSRTETDAFDEPGHYVTFLGCEWSPPTRDGGDRNVFYRNDEPRLRRSARFFEEETPDPEPDIPTAAEFHDAFREENVLINMHVGGRMTNLDWHEPAIEQLAETHSTHGTSDWFVMDCLDRGFQVGLTAGTDGVMGRPGACHPGSRVMRNVPNGLTAIIAEELTRESLWSAMRARRCYATTGQRILLSVTVDDHPMGAAVCLPDPPLIRIFVEGTAAIEQIELLRGTEIFHTWNPASRMPPSSGIYRVLWTGTAKRGTARLQKQVWDGSLTLAGGTITRVEPVGFYSPLDGISLDSPERVSWKSCTAGNDAGFLFHFQNDSPVKGRFQTEPCSFDFSLAETHDNPMEVDAGGVGRRVSIGPAPEATASRRVQLTFRDEEPVEGMCPYWIRVYQVDREKAWSTPVYVTRGDNGESPNA